ncbi:hypothetical protein HPB50_019164 [Hyalomma asiaticum]|uniref:Uncharacterized protein n=1 Tax=Hyalomma asiaticum TaxID=266040 RepID=A0ACB7T1W4_HYAAI|nr:hypothetical protein HPB50_019164 [Hyalomma asiaticum]
MELRTRILFFSKSTNLRRRDFGGITVLTAGDTVTFADHVRLEGTFMVPLSRALSHSRDSGGVETVDLFGSVPELDKELWVTELGRYASVSRPLVFRTKKPGYVGAFLELWKVRGEREMHLFFSWSIVQTAALYANRRLLINFYGCEDCADLYHGAFCLSKAYLLTGNQLFQEYFDELFSERAMNSARHVVSDTFDAFALQLDAWPYRDANLTAVKDSKADRDLVLDYFNPHSGRDKRKHAEAAVFNPGDLDDSLVGNWQSIAPHIADVRHRWAAAEQIEFVEWTVLLPDHVVAVLPHALSFPSFDESATRFMNQGGLGNHVALALSERFFRSYADSSEAAFSASQYRECATNATHFGDSSSAAGLSSVAMRTLALEVSLNAYHAGAPQHRRENLDGFEGYNATAMFFVASCYALCGGHDGVLHFTGYECDEAFRNVSGFAEAFACEPGSLITPLNRCGLM